MANTKVLYGLYDDDDVLLHGIKSLREKGIEIQDVYTPFPIHGLDHALGLKPSRLSEAGFFYGAYGLFLAISMTLFIMNYDWPQDIGGKPAVTNGSVFDGWIHNMPAFVPVMFELTVFCTAHLMVITYLIRNKLYPGAKPQNPDVRTTDDKFMVEIAVKENESELVEALKESGVIEIATN